MDGSGNCKLPSTPPIAPISAEFTLNMNWYTLDFLNICGGYHGTFNVTRYGHSMKSGILPQVKNYVCPKREYNE
jgi:hypothetical protein